MKLSKAFHTKSIARSDTIITIRVGGMAVEGVHVRSLRGLRRGRAPWPDYNKPA